REQGVILRRGRVQVWVSGDRAIETVQIIAETMKGDGATIAEVCSLFASPDHPAVVELIEQLSLRTLVVPADSDLIPIDHERPLDVFYWHVGASAGEVNQRLNQMRIAVIGVNHVSSQIIRSLTAAGTTNFKVIDYPLLRNLALFDGSGAVSG